MIWTLSSKSMFKHLDSWEDGRTGSCLYKCSCPATHTHTHPEADGDAVHGETNKSHHPTLRTPGECLTTKLRTHRRRFAHLSRRPQLLTGCQSCLNWEKQRRTGGRTSWGHTAWSRFQKQNLGGEADVSAAPLVCRGDKQELGSQTRQHWLCLIQQCRPNLL